jgi:hypothetical protein
VNHPRDNGGGRNTDFHVSADVMVLRKIFVPKGKEVTGVWKCAPFVRFTRNNFIIHCTNTTMCEFHLLQFVSRRLDTFWGTFRVKI